MSSKRPTLLVQGWRDLLFLHWPIDPARIQATLPPGLRVDCYDGTAYLGIVPFYMDGLRPRFCPPVPGISYFPELNLRTYVRDAEGRPGVWFYSLDAQSRISVAIAQTCFQLPYVYARMRHSVDTSGLVELKAQRGNTEPQRFAYRPTRVIGPAMKASLSAFLVERYRLFAYAPKRKQLIMGELTHQPYILHEVEVREYSKALFALNGFDTPSEGPCHAVYSKGVDVEVFPMSRTTVS